MAILASRPIRGTSSSALSALIALTVSLPLCSAPLRASGPGLSAAAAAARIDPPSLLAAIRFLAADELEGRGPGSLGDVLTRRFLATQLEGLGYSPGGAEGSYEQRFEMVGVESVAPERWVFRAADSTVELERGEEFVAVAGGQSPVVAVEDAELVFVGYGIQAPEYDWDDFAGADLNGKMLVVLNNDPDWSDDLFAGNRRLYYGRWTYKYESAARQGAAGAIIIHTTPSAGYPWQVVQTSWGGEAFKLPAGDEAKLPIEAWATESATRRLLAAAGHDLDELIAAAHRPGFRPVPLGIRTSLGLENRMRRIETANILGLLPGGDPELSDEVVIYTAHHDHLGMAEPAAGAPDDGADRIYNGAVDNATGVSQLLRLARAFADLAERPRRSILFAFVAAEEQGLLGSAYYASHPTFAPGRIAANINLDAGNVFGPTRDITYVGMGKSSLDAVIIDAAATQGRIVKGDQFPDRGSFYRSDQFNFAKIGVPALYLDGGTDFVGKDAEFGKGLQERYESTCYHQPCDEVSPEWDLSGMVEDTRLAFLAGLSIANADDLPAWNPGDEFEAARLAALAAVQTGH